ncbi:MAG: type II toxin-antitoxin system Phd/YefM family antitoxin [Thermomicrobiales bacterium]
MATEMINERMPVTKVRDDLDAVIDHAQETKQPIVVTRDGKAAVVIVDFAQYQKEMDERDIFRAVLEGRRDVREGRVYTLEEVEAELDALLSE